MTPDEAAVKSTKGTTARSAARVFMVGFNVYLLGHVLCARACVCVCVCVRCGGCRTLQHPVGILAASFNELLDALLILLVCKIYEALAQVACVVRVTAPVGGDQPGDQQSKRCNRVYTQRKCYHSCVPGKLGAYFSEELPVQVFCRAHARGCLLSTTRANSHSCLLEPCRTIRCSYKVQ